MMVLNDRRIHAFPAYPYLAGPLGAVLGGLWSHIVLSASEHRGAFENMSLGQVVLYLGTLAHILDSPSLRATISRNEPL